MATQMNGMTAEAAMHRYGSSVYAYTPNGREIREVIITLKSGHIRQRYCVQPHDDNYWLILRTSGAALKAYYHPERYR